MTHMKSVIILSAAATLMSAAPALAQYGSGSSRSNTPVSQPRASVPSTSSVNRRSQKTQQDALSKKQEFERRIALQEAQAAKYRAAAKASEGAKKTTTAYGSSNKGAVLAQEKPYGSDTKTINAAQTPPNTGLTILCPSGTTVQPNGTCLVTSGSLPGS